MTCFSIRLLLSLQNSGLCYDHSQYTWRSPLYFGQCPQAKFHLLQSWSHLSLVPALLQSQEGHFALGLLSLNRIFVKVMTLCVPLHHQEAGYRLTRLRNKFPILEKWFPVWKGMQRCGPPSGLECHLWCPQRACMSRLNFFFYLDPYWGSMPLTIPHLPGSTFRGEREISAVSQGRGKLLRASSSPSCCPGDYLNVFLPSGFWLLEPRTGPIDGVSASPFQTALEGVLSLDSEVEDSETVVGLDRHGASLHHTLWLGET